MSVLQEEMVIWLNMTRMCYPNPSSLLFSIPIISMLTDPYTDLFDICQA
jgi:hypothetical protein